MDVEPTSSVPSPYSEVPEPVKRAVFGLGHERAQPGDFGLGAGGTVVVQGGEGPKEHNDVAGGDDSQPPRGARWARAG